MTQATRAAEKDTAPNWKRNIALSRWAERPSLVFVTAFEKPRAIPTFVIHIVCESEVRIAEQPDPIIHSNGEKFLGPNPDVYTSKL